MARRIEGHEEYEEHQAAAARRELPDAPGTLALWFGLIGGPAIVLVMQQLLYAATPWGCVQRTKLWLYAIPVVGLAAALAAALVAWSAWRRARTGVRLEDWDPEEGDPWARIRFMAALGIIASLFSAMAVVAMWLPVFYLNPCVRT